MVLLHVRNSQHATLFHPEGRFLDFSDEIGKFLFGIVQKKLKPERRNLEIVEMVERLQFPVFDDRRDSPVQLLKSNSLYCVSTSKETRNAQDGASRDTQLSPSCNTAW